MLPKENSTVPETQSMLDQQQKKVEKKPSKFSLKWLLRRTRETKTPAGQSEKPNNIGKGVNIMPKSKSLDVSLTLTTRKEHYQTQHLPSSASMNDKDKICNLGVPYLKLPRKISACGGLPAKSIATASQMFKTSYSSNDVQTLLTPNHTPSHRVCESSSMARLKNQEPGSSGCFAPIHKPSPLTKSREKFKTSTSDLNNGVVIKSRQDLYFPELAMKEDKGNKEVRVDPLGTPGTSLSKINLIPMPYPPSIYNSTASGLNVLGGSNLLCRLCLMLVPTKELYTFEECGCVFCVICIKQYLTINIREGNINLSCPDAKCGKKGLINMREVEQLVEREIFHMYQRFKLNREVELDPTRTWCPGIDCETICYVRPSSDKQSGVLVHCPNCQFKFCSSCKDHWHSNKTCEQVHKEKHEELTFLVEQDDDPRIKRCPNPNCRVPIERDEGCAQMMCKQCKHVFCWYCLTSLDDDFLLRHYDKGPCKNKLGHSRASVVWHRTQVVGIFAGFGFLLLVASPLLLLAAPCLLCCRCKQCTKFFDEEPSTV